MWIYTGKEDAKAHWSPTPTQVPSHGNVPKHLSWGERTPTRGTKG